MNIKTIKSLLFILDIPLIPVKSPSLLAAREGEAKSAPY